MPDFYYFLDELAGLMNGLDLDEFIHPDMTDEQIAEKVLPLVKQIWNDADMVQQLVPDGKVMEESWSASVRSGACTIHVRQRIMPPIHITVQYKQKREPMDDYVQKIIDRREKGKRDG